MNRILRPLLGTALAVIPLALLAESARGVQPVPPASPVVRFAPAVAATRAGARVWTAAIAGGIERVLVASPAEAPGRLAGPGGGLDDGAPSVTVIGDDRFLVAASRVFRAGSRVWVVEWRGDRPGTPRFLRRGGRYNHHPAIATGGGVTWMVWVSSDASAAGERLVATRWQGDSWGPLERLPQAPQSPMAPALAVDSRSRPLVVYAAGDGHDAEIWVSVRGNHGWTPARSLTDDQRPDIMPTVGFFHDRPLVAWASAEADGYYPLVRRGGAGGRRWQAPHRLSRRPGSSPQVVATGSSAAVVWAQARPSDYLLQGSSWRRSWSHPRSLGAVASPRISANVWRGRAALAWFSGTQASGGRLAGLNERPGGLRLTPFAGTRATRRSASAAATVALPGTYRAFGDSITQGIERFDGEIFFTDGYPVPLAGLITGLIGRTVTVRNDGLGGEMTSDGVNRFRSLHASSPKLFTFLMEGTNDISNLVDAHTIAENLRTMVRAVHDSGNEVVVSNLPPRRNMSFGGSVNIRTDEANTAIAAMAAQERALFVDQHAAFFKQNKLYSDLIHPNDDGYQVMAKVWFAGVEPLLRRLLEQEEAERDHGEDLALSGASRHPIQ